MYKFYPLGMPSFITWCKSWDTVPKARQLAVRSISAEWCVVEFISDGF